MSDDLIEELRRIAKVGFGYDIAQHDRVALNRAADALAAKDTALSEMRAELERWAEQANKEDECRQIWQAQALAAEAQLERVKTEAAAQFKRDGEKLTEADRRAEALRKAIEDIIDAANSFQDEEGYEVAGQIRIRAARALAPSIQDDGGEL